ncbi:PDR/VanB family oxidoreductase [Pseudonocardia sp.]|uniref:PDR/VanB family oxidoreductase n=1 Tax=Pseudonocardia sp. TaxID=60912 RepID=UPI003D0D98A8
MTYTASTERLELVVRAVSVEAERIKTFELADPSGAELPEFTAGSHVDVEVPGGLVRQYSLSNSPVDRLRYEISVLAVDGGRGGSHAMHHDVRCGDKLRVSPPRNTFALDETARHHVLVAGGIGITPIMSMVERLTTLAASYTLVYCTRSPGQTAFHERLLRLAAERMILHHDGGDPARSIDLATILTPGPGTHLYCCGPEGMMRAVGVATAAWIPGHVHVERFTNPGLDGGAVTTGAGGFEIVLASSERRLMVAPHESIIDVLRAAGIAVDSSCEAGVCGTCVTGWLDGAPDHRDLVLTDEERGHSMTICCSRSLTRRLVLDL